jgi:propanol-preferring alcohol dehydrogenase
VTARGGAIVVTGNGGGRLCLEAIMGGGRAPDREVTMLHTWGGSRGDLEEVIALARAGRIESRTQTFALEQAGAALRDLEAGRVIGRAVVVPDLERA